MPSEDRAGLALDVFKKPIGAFLFSWRSALVSTRKWMP